MLGVVGGDVTAGGAAQVSGEDGLLALRTALSITEQVANSHRKFA